MTEQVERLAHHALRGDLWEKAGTYLRQAGLRVMVRGVTREAVAHLEAALVALRRLPSTRETTELTIDIHLDLRNAHPSVRSLVAHEVVPPWREGECYEYFKPYFAI
jgi:hypothetical protein